MLESSQSTSDSRFKTYIVVAAVFLFPLVAFANGGGYAWFFFFGLMAFIILVALAIPISLLYVFRSQSHVPLLLLSIVISLAYAFVVNFIFPSYDVLEMLGFTIAIVVVFFLFLGFILLIRSQQGKDNFSVKKVFFYSVVVSVFTIIFIVLYTNGAAYVLYATSCDVNLILELEEREREVGICIVKQAVERHDPVFCDKAGNNFLQRDFCKARVWIESIESGNMSDCTHLRSLPRNIIKNAIGGWSLEHEQELLANCDIL